jgi:hypothetical protein
VVPRDRLNLNIVETNKQTNSVVSVRKRPILTERRPLVGEVSAELLRIEGVAWSAQRIPTAVNLGFLDRKLEAIRIIISRCFIFERSRARLPVPKAVIIDFFIDFLSIFTYIHG